MLKVRKNDIFACHLSLLLIYLLLFIYVFKRPNNYFLVPLLTKMVKMFSSLSQLVSY